MATQGKDTEVVFLSAARTGMGTFGGSLKDFSATDLGVFAAKAALERGGVPAEEVGHVVFGNALQTSADAIYLARHIGLRAGLPHDTPALTLNRLCGSGFQAIISGAMEIMLGEAEVALCGGTESMSQAPHVIRGARWGEQRLGPVGKLYEDSLWEALTDTFRGLLDGGDGREPGRPVRHHRGAGGRVRAPQPAARQGGVRAEPLRQRDRPHHAQEPQGRHGVPLRRAHASRDDDGDARQAEAVLQGGRHRHRRQRLRHRRRRRGDAHRQRGVRAAATACSPSAASCRGGSPAWTRSTWGSARRRPRGLALKRGDMDLGQMDLVEINEAFASQYCAVEKELGLDRERTNVSGGAIAMSHPLGMSGARITVHLLHELRRQGKRFGLGSACIGGGQGIAVVVEAFPAAAEAAIAAD
jgi:hypothetical protein